MSEPAITWEQLNPILRGEPPYRHGRAFRRHVIDQLAELMKVWRRRSRQMFFQRCASEAERHRRALPVMTGARWA